MGKARILCVDDDPIMQRIYNHVLSELFTLDFALTGQQAVELCKIHRYDVIFMDVRMPGLTGFEATQQIHSANKNQNTPIIGVTACGWRNLTKETENMNFYLLLDKPMVFEEMLAAAQKAISSQSN